MLEKKKRVQEGKIISIVKSGSLSIYNDAIKRFKEFMQGSDIKEYNIGSDLKITKLGMISRLKNSHAIFTLGSIATVAVKEIVKFKPVPIVFGMVLEPDRNNIPDEYVAGIQSRVSLLSSVIPLLSFKSFTKVGVIISQENMKFIEKEKHSLTSTDVLLLSKTIKSDKEIKATFLTLKEKGIEVLWLYPDKWLTEDNFEILLRESLKAKIPINAPSEHFVKKGAFLSVYGDPAGVVNQAAVITKDLFFGKKISEIGIQYPASTKTICNLTTAKQLNLKLNNEFKRSCDVFYK